MTSITSPVGTSAPRSSATGPSAGLAASTTPGRLRRSALVVTGVLACALPVVFTINLTRMLLTGELAEHRFHQLTGQGLVLFAFWLVPLVGLLRAGWAGRRPSTATGYQHLGFVVLGAVSAVAAPGGGAPYLVGVIAVTGALVWAALPHRPRLRTSVLIDPVLAPVSLVGAALLVPYAVSQIGLQNQAVGHHAENPHLFDMAWLVLTATALAVLAAITPAARHLVGWLAGCCVVTGVAGLVLGEDLAWMLPMAALGLVAAAATGFTRRTRAIRIA